MKIYIINLRKSANRRIEMAAELGRFGLDHEFFPAIEGDHGHEFFDGYDQSEFLLNSGRNASPGEVGCYASHLTLWRQSLERNEPVLVLEDDALLTPRFGDALQIISRLISDYDFIRMQTLGPERNQDSMPVERIGDFTIDYCSRYPYGAMAYAVSPVEARRLLAASRTLTGPVDLILRNFWDHGQPLFAISPNVVQAADSCMETTIGERPKEHLGTTVRIHRALRKLGWRRARSRFNRAFIETYHCTGRGDSTITHAMK
jgi:glycosyl transferase family 25